MDEKSLIKKYQKEISNLKEELQQLKRGMMGNNPYTAPPNQEDLVNLKLQLEAGQVKLQSRLEEEEQAKAALMGRIQRLTKLILVSTKSTMPPNITEKLAHRRRHSFGEDELAYLPERKKDENIIEDDVGSVDSDFSSDRRSEVTNLDEVVKDYRRNKRHGMLGWFKLKKPDQNGDSESSGTNSPASSSKSAQNRISFIDSKRKSVSRKNDEHAADVVDFLPERTQAGDLFSATLGARHLPSSGTTISDQMDLFREQIKMLAGEVALCTSSLKRLSEQSANNPHDSQLKEQSQRMKDEIREKKHQMRILEQRMMGSVDNTHSHTSNSFEISQALSKLASQLNEKTFELEIKSADNRILQEQLQIKISENSEMQETILLLRQQLDSLLSERSSTQESGKNKVTSLKSPWSEESLNVNEVETFGDQNTPTSVMSLNRVFSPENLKECGSSDTDSNSQLLIQAAEIETLKREKVMITEEKDGLIIQSQKLAEEGSYAKELAAAAAVELRNLAEEVTKLSYQNAKLTNDLKETTNRCHYCKNSADFSSKNRGYGKTEEFEREQTYSRFQRQASLISVLSDKDKMESELRNRLDEAKRHERDLENELSNMWDLIAKMKKSGNYSEDVAKTGVRDEYTSVSDQLNKVQNANEMSKFDEFKDRYDNERRKCKELEKLVLRLKGDNVTGLDITTLEELQNLHVEAITKICHAKCSNHLL
jgi:centromeric protein E